MHTFLSSLKYRPPSLSCFVAIGCFYLLSKAFLVLLMHRLIQVYLMLVLHSNVNKMPILGCLRLLLLSLFIKSDHASKCGVTWLIKEFNKSLTFWILPKLHPDHLCVVYQQSSSIDFILDYQSDMKLPLVEPYFLSICYHQPSWNC
jgi:hypothetical protein